MGFFIDRSDVRGFLVKNRYWRGEKPKYIHHHFRNGRVTLPHRYTELHTRAQIHAYTHTRIYTVSFEEKSTTLSQRRKQSSHSPVSLDAVPRELVRDKGGNKSQSTMAFLARFPRTVLRHLQQCSLADDHGDSFFALYIRRCVLDNSLPNVRNDIIDLL